MSLSISIPKTGEQVPLDGLLSLARTAFGLGIGMLVADKIRHPFRQETGIALVYVRTRALQPQSAPLHPRRFRFPLRHRRALDCLSVAASLCEAPMATRQQLDSK